MEILPIVSEKAYAEETKHTYLFRVPAGASKQAIAKVIAETFNVTVEDVRTLTRKGKKTRYSRGKHAYPGTTYRQDKHIAYVTIKEGEKIPVFDNEEDEKASADKSAKTEAKAKKADKPAKETKDQKGAK